jgi:hypothetical protein
MTELSNIIKKWAKKITVQGKMGRDIMQPSLSQHLEQCGYDICMEDSRQFLRAKMPVWRKKYEKEIEETIARRKIDIIVYSSNKPIALIEIESDLKHARDTEVTKSNKRYDVFSIAKNGNGVYFNSYKSLERMAAAAFYYHLSQESETINDKEAVTSLESISSDNCEDHNPIGIPLFLVIGTCQTKHKIILAERLKATGAELICVSDY